MIQHPEILLILARERQAELRRESRLALPRVARERRSPRTALARRLRDLADRLETCAPEGRQAHA